MKLSQFKFQFTDSLIAKYPAENRDEAKLMILDRKKGKIPDDHEMLAFSPQPSRRPDFSTSTVSHSWMHSLLKLVKQTEVARFV